MLPLYQARTFFKIVITSVPRALRASVRSTELSKMESAETLKHGRSFAKQFSGERIRKTSANVFEIWSRPRGGGSGEESARASAFIFLAGRATRKNTRKMIKSFYEQSIRDVGGYRRKR